MRQRPPGPRPATGSVTGNAAQEKPTLRPFPAEATTAPGAGAAESHERVRPRLATLMSAFANHLASTQPPLTAASADGTTAQSILLQMSELFARAEFDGAFAIAERIDTTHPAHDVVSYCTRACRTELEGHYRERLGTLEHAPRVVLSGEDVQAIALDHREAFVLSQIDGQTSYDAVVDVSALPRFQTLAILDHLLSLGVIE